MKKFILSVMVTMAIISLPAFAQQLAEDSPHLYLMLHDTDLDGMNMNIGADLDKKQAGDQTNKGTGDAGKEKHDVLYQHLHQEVNFRQGAVPVVKSLTGVRPELDSGQKYLLMQL